MRYTQHVIAALLLIGTAAICSTSAQAQPSTVVAACGAQSIPLSQYSSGTYIDQTGNLCTNASGGSGTGGAVYGPTATGAAAANPPVIVGGTATGSATGNVQGVAMKPSSTAAAATDPSLVVTESPNSTLSSGMATVAGAVGDPIPDCSTNPCTNHIGLADQGRAGTDPWAVAIKGATTGGATPAGYVSTASTNATNVKNAAGTVKAMNFINTTQTIGYVRTYNLSSTPTCSSATGFIRSWPVPPASASGLAGGLAAQLPVEGTAFGTGIGFCITGGGSSTDNTNAPAGIYFNIDYF